MESQFKDLLSGASMNDEPAPARPARPAPRVEAAGAASNVSPQQQSRANNRPEWDSRPRRNPPATLRGIAPHTKEPWCEVQQDDLKTKVEAARAGVRRKPTNSLVEAAKERRQEKQSARAWDSSPVRRQPAALRGQKASTRREPWSAGTTDDDISQLNAIDGVSVNELYNITADRDNRVESTRVNPVWDDSRKIGRTRPRQLHELFGLR